MQMTLPSRRSARAFLMLPLGLIMLALFCLSAIGSPAEPTTDLREIEVNLDLIGKNVAGMAELLAGIAEQFGSTERLKQMQVLLHEMSGATESLQVNVSQWPSGVPSPENQRDFRLTLGNLSQTALKLHRLLEPQAITKMDSGLELQEIRFAMNRTMNAIRRLDRLMADPARLAGAPTEAASLRNLHRYAQHAIADVELVQSRSASLDQTGRENWALAAEIGHSLDHAAQDLQQLQGLLDLFKLKVPEGEARTGPLRLLIFETSEMIYGLLAALYPESPPAMGERDPVQFFSALDQLQRLLYELKTGLNSLSFIEDGATAEARQQLARFDQDGDCQISNAEFLAALQQWNGGEIDRHLLKAVADAWLMEISVCPAGSDQPRASSSPVPVALFVQTQVTAGWIAISIHGPNIVASKLEIFDANGVKVAEQHSSGRRLSWQLKTTRASAAANGVYFYRVVGRTTDGTLISTKIKPLAVLR